MIRWDESGPTLGIRLIALACLILGTIAGFQAIARGYSRALGREGLVRLPSARRGEPVATVPLVRGTIVVHRFVVDRDHWVGFGIRTVTWGHFPRPGRCSWVLFERQPGKDERTEVRRGSFRASRLRDGTSFPVRFAGIPDSAGRTYELEFSGPDVSADESVGLPIYPATGEASVRVEVRSEPDAEPPVLPDSSIRLTLDLGPIHQSGRGERGRSIAR